MECRRYKEEEIEFIKDNYGYIPIKEIAIKLGRGYHGVRSKICKLNLSNGKRTFASNVDMNFFYNWSPELAYVIGFFLADGHMSNYSKEMRYYIVIRCIDRDIIEKIADVSGYKNNVLPFKDRDSIMYSISFAGKFIWEFFNSLSFDNNKTFTAKIPKQIPENLMRHCIRGIFDGDGSLSLRRKNYPSLNVVGSEKVIVEIGKLCDYYNNLKQHKNIWRVDYNGRNAMDFLSWIYKDSTIYMNRKHKLYLRSLKWKNVCIRWSSEEKGLLKQLYPTTYAKNLTNTFDRSISSMTSMARKLDIKRNYVNGKI